MTKRPQHFRAKLRTANINLTTAPRTPSIDLQPAFLRPVKSSNTANMVAMYTIAGRQVGSHIVRYPETALEKFDGQVLELSLHA
jgi:hypothetical protein